MRGIEEPSVVTEQQFCEEKEIQINGGTFSIRINDAIIC
jgi:hypothetical protein